MKKAAVLLPFRRNIANDGQCPTHGPYEPRTVGAPPFVVPIGCPTCADEIKARNRASELRGVIEERIGRSNIPNYYRNYSLDTYPAHTPQQRAALKICVDYARDYGSILHRAPGTNWMLLFGGVGAGKTSLACSVLSRIAEQDRGVFFATASAIRQKIAGAYLTGTSRERVIAYLASVDLLAVDEIGASADDEKSMAAEQVELFEVLNRRYQDNRPTILVTNLPKFKSGKYEGPILRDAIGDRLDDRLRSAVHVPCNWPSLRK